LIKLCERLWRKVRAVTLYKLRFGAVKTIAQMARRSLRRRFSDVPEDPLTRVIRTLSRKPDDLHTAAAFARFLHSQGQSLAVADGLQGWCLTTDPHARDLEPFVFMHIPKTAGSVIRLVILSLFDASRIYPWFNYHDFNPRKGGVLRRFNPRKYGVFIGHLRWDAVEFIENRLRREANIFTILRDPVAHYRSQLSFVDALADQGITQTKGLGKEFDFVDYWDDETRKRLGVSLVNSQIFSFIPERASSSFIPKARTKTLIRFEETCPGARDILDDRLGRTYFGFAEDLRRSLDLLCKKLHLPYQFIPDLRLNRSFADHAKPLNTREQNQVDQYCRLSLEFNAEARRRFETEYEKAFANVDDIPGHLNSAYRAKLRSKLKAHWCLHLEAGNAWPGYGWGYRQSNECSQSWRQLAPFGTSAILTRLRVGCDYIVRISIHSCDSLDTASRIAVTANGLPLSVHWQSYIGKAYGMSWSVPSACLTETDGFLELVFSLQKNWRDELQHVFIDTIQLYPVQES
jgi:hypothetical protein